MNHNNTISTVERPFFKFPAEKEESKTLFPQIDLIKTPSCDNAAYKKKKSLKLQTQNPSNDDPDKVKLFTPQPAQNFECTMMFLNSINSLSHPPTRKFKAQNSREFHNFSYQGDVHEVVMKRCSHKNQEDRFCATLINKKDPFFGVFDGHGSSLVSELLSEVFHKYIQSQEDYESNTLNALKTACLKFDEELLSLLQKNNAKGGSTALMCLIRDRTLFVVNVGDSLSAVLKSDQAILLNKQHTPQDETERKTLDLRGAIIIEKNKIFRVLGELAVSRAFGDKNYKDYITAEPEISVFDLDKLKADYLLMASDGFWNLVSVQELPSLYKKWQVESKEGLGQFLISEAESRFPDYRKDNMTMIAVNLRNLDQMKDLILGSLNERKKIPQQVQFDFSSDVE